MKLQFKFSKEGSLRFISHLDLQQLFIRAFRRAKLPVAVKGGFSPQPKMSFASALPLGYTSSGEYLEVELTEDLPPREVKERLAAQLPEGIYVNQVEEVPSEKPSLMSRLVSALYLITFTTVQPFDRNVFEDAVKEVLQNEEVIIVRRSKKKVKRLNIIPYILNIEVLPTNSQFQGAMRLHLESGQGGSVKPTEILNLLEKQNSMEILERKAHREALFIE